MRHAASEKSEIIWLAEGSHLSASMTLAKLGIPRTIIYHRYNRHLDYKICIFLTKLTAFEADLEVLEKALKPQELAPSYFHPNLAKHYERLVFDLRDLLNKPDCKQQWLCCINGLMGFTV